MPANEAFESRGDRRVNIKNNNVRNARAKQSTQTASFHSGYTSNNFETTPQLIKIFHTA